MLQRKFKTSCRYSSLIKVVALTGYNLIIGTYFGVGI